MARQKVSSLINRVGFRQLLFIVFSLGIVILSLLSALVSSNLSSQSLKERLSQEGVKLVETFVDQSRVALLYRSVEDAKYAGEAMLAFPDVQAIGIFDEASNELYTSGQWANERASEWRWPNEVALDYENANVWNFVAPVYTGVEEESSPFMEAMEPEHVGYVRVLVSKESLHQMEKDIYAYNLLVSLAIAVVLSFVLLSVTNRITRPINNLANIMRRARQGERDVRADVKGTREVIQMEKAFNTMMEVLYSREEDLKNARDLALEAARVKGEFAANVSHELRTPLNGVVGMLDLLKEMGLNTKQAEYVDIAAGSADALLELIDDILDFSKMDSGKLLLEDQRFDLSDLLDEILMLLSTQAQKKDLDLAYIIAPGVPLKLNGDSSRLRQVLINLVANALKFTERGEVGISVSLQPDEEQREGFTNLRFDVTDTGIGLSEGVQDKIFEAFSQGDGSTTRKYGGTGLGLAISQQLVSLLGGSIGVESQLGKGSTFWFNVFMEPDTSLSLANKDKKEAEKLPLNTKALIVDDSSLSREYLGQLFNQLGAEFEATGDTSLALDKLRLAAKQGAPYRLILIDDVMPGMKGGDLVRHIVNDPVLIQTQIVMMANHASPIADDVQQRNIAGYLSKPVTKRALFDTIKSVVVSPALGNMEPANEEVFAKEKKANVVSFNGSRVLVVEDNRANQQVAIGILERLGCKPVLASNGKEAIALIARQDYDLVLMDCHMPEMDGYEATSQIRRIERYKTLPIVAMTANVQQGEDQKCLAVGMNDYIPKPLKTDILRDKLSRWLPFTEVSSGGENGLVSADENDRAEGIIDYRVINELKEQIGNSLKTLIQVFLDDSPNYIRSLKDAVSVKDAKASADIAHALKGSASNFGAQRLYKACQNLESSGREGDLQHFDQQLETLIAETGLVQQALEELLTDRVEASSLREDSQSYAAAITESETSGQESAYHNHHGRVLIVDDDSGMRFAMRKVLESEGYLVDEVKNGEQALVYCERFMPDLVLMDAVMPEMDGFKACSEIQALPNGNQVPVLIITALNDEASIGRAFASGAVDYIAKPVNFAVLRKRIARILQASQTEKYVRHLAYNDTLTGLANRTMFNERLEEMLQDPKRNEGKLALLFLDLDRFKLVNDTFGHDAGDLLLKVVSERLQGCVRQGDLVSRFGGDEFVIVLDRVHSYEVVKNVAKKIHQNLSRPFVFLGREMHVSTSIGISIYPDDGTEMNTLLKHADAAMYRAKDKRNCYEFYDVKMGADAARRLGLESDLRSALEHDEMVLYYQPQMDLRTGLIIGMEALVRWNHPHRGLISPLEFISLAEETGQIIELGEWVLREACEQLKRWQQQGCSPMRMAVNLAGRQLDNNHLVDQVAAVLRETELDPSCLELEITESTIMENAESVVSILNKLKAMGVKLAVDDFGTGYSSLNYLKRFPIDLLKIDRSFVSDITIDKVDADIVSTIITLAHSLGVEVIAEGVETHEQRDYLKRESCDLIQGYLLSKPLPADEFEKRFIKQGPRLVIDNAKSS